MSESVTQSQAPQPGPDERRRRLMWLAVAMALLVVAGVSGLLLLGQRDGDRAGPASEGEPTATEPHATPTDPTPGSTLTELTAPPTAAQSRCAVPQPQILARHQLAFDGTVTEVSDHEVTLRPTRFYAGEPTDLVTVTAPPEELRALLASVEFRVGQRYLVAADDGVVSICGYSGRWSHGLERLYLRAFSE